MGKIHPVGKIHPGGKIHRERKIHPVGKIQLVGNIHLVGKIHPVGEILSLGKIHSFAAWGPLWGRSTLWAAWSSMQCARKLEPQLEPQMPVGDHYVEDSNVYLDVCVYVNLCTGVLYVDVCGCILILVCSFAYIYTEDVDQITELFSW